MIFNYYKSNVTSSKKKFKFVTSSKFSKEKKRRENFFKFSKEVRGDFFKNKNYKIQRKNVRILLFANKKGKKKNVTVEKRKKQNGG